MKRHGLRGSEPAVSAPEPAGRTLEPGERALESAGRPEATWEGQLRAPEEEWGNGAFLV